MFYVIHLEETDGDIHYEPCNDIDAVNLYLLEHDLYEEDYNVINGEMMTQ